MSALPIKIYIRTRPTTDFAGDNLKILDDHQTITVNIDKSDPLNFLNNPTCDYTFKFHSILHNANQEIVFEEAAREIIDSFIQGYNGCLFAYGQRNSGKTFTMFGSIRNFKYRGIVPRTLAYVFSELEKFKTINFTLSLQYCSIFNDIIFDLLSDEEKEMQVGDEDGNPYIQNLSTHYAKTVHEALQLLITGDEKLHLMEHKYNRKVYRSHCIFIMDLIGRKGTRMTHSKLWLLDLAAAEEAVDSAFVNKSIAYLRQVIVSINGARPPKVASPPPEKVAPTSEKTSAAPIPEKGKGKADAKASKSQAAQAQAAQAEKERLEKEKAERERLEKEKAEKEKQEKLKQKEIKKPSAESPYLPFRRSKLTSLLREAIGGNCRTAMIATIWPEKKNNNETISTFQFGSDVSKVKNDAKVNTLEPPELQIEKLKSELEILQQEKDLQDELAGQVKVDGLTQAEELEVADQVALFLRDEIETIPLHSAAHIRAIFTEIRKRYQDIPNQVMREVQANFTLTERVKNPKAPKDVGTIDSTGFSIGVAASQDRPFNIRSATKSDHLPSTASGRAENPPIPTTEQLFEIYKQRDGKVTSSELISTKQATRELVEQKKKLVMEINERQKEIMQLKEIIEKEQLKQKDKLFEEEAEILDNDVKAKQDYKRIYEELQKTQSEIEGLKEKCAQIRIVLLGQFEEWSNKWKNNELYTEPVVPPHNESEAAGKESANSKLKGKKDLQRGGKAKQPLRKK